MSEHRAPTFWGLKEPEYPGSKHDGCPPGCDEAVSWMAHIGGTLYNFNSPQELVGKVQEMLTHAYQEGRAHQRADIIKRFGLGG